MRLSTFPTGTAIFIFVPALRIDLVNTLTPSQQIRGYIPRGKVVEAYLSPATSIEAINARNIRLPPPIQFRAWY